MSPLTWAYAIFIENVFWSRRQQQLNIFVPHGVTSFVTSASHIFVKRGAPAKLRLMVEYEHMPVASSTILVLGGSIRQVAPISKG
jgi:hypothetical protein